MPKRLLASLALLACGEVAPASIIPTFISLSNLSPGLFAYEYDLVVQAPDQRLQARTADGFDNGFTFYDVAGATGAASCTGLHCDSFVTSFLDIGRGALADLVFSYAGDETLAPGTTLGRFALVTTAGEGRGVVIVGGMASANAPGSPTDGFLVEGTTWVAGPAAQTGSTPEAWSIVLLGSGLLALGMFRSRTRHPK